MPILLISIMRNCAKLLLSFILPPKTIVCVCVCIQHCWHDNAHIYSIFVDCIKVRTSLSWPIEHLFPSFDLRPVSRNLSIVISKYYALHEEKPNDVANLWIKKCVKFCICCSVNFTSLIYFMHAVHPIIIERYSILN